MKKGLLFLFAGGTSYAFVINLCALIYTCGCHSWWAGAAEGCNIHDHEARHCPWCSMGDLGFYSILGCILLAQAVIAFGSKPTSWLHRVSYTFLAFPVIGTVLGVALGLQQGYWK